MKHGARTVKVPWAGKNSRFTLLFEGDDRITMAQIAFGAALGYLDFRFADLGWRTARPALTA